MYISRQAVRGYTEKHYDELMQLVDNQDALSALTSKHIAMKAKGRLNYISDTCQDFNKKDLVPLNIVAGTQDDKYRLLSGQSTENVYIHPVYSSGRKKGFDIILLS